MIAISTAYNKALIGVNINGQEAFKELDSNCKHSENILLSIDELLEKIGKSIDENDSYGVVIGPGSFTGLRIAISLIKGFLVSQTGKKIIPITTNELMAYSFLRQNNIDEDFICVIDALSGLYYISKFNKHGQKIEEERIIDKNELNIIKSKKVSLECDSIEQADFVVSITAEDLLQISLKKLKFGEIIGEEELKPLYLRKSQAEQQLDDKKN